MVQPVETEIKLAATLVTTNFDSAEHCADSRMRRQPCGPLCQIPPRHMQTRRNRLASIMPTENRPGHQPSLFSIYVPRE